MQIQTVGILSAGDMGQAMSDDKPLACGNAPRTRLRICTQS